MSEEYTRDITIRFSPDQHTTISNSFIQDPTVSLRLKGMLALLMSFAGEGPKQGKIEDWVMSRTKEGITAIRRCIRDLEELGYIKRVMYRHKANKQIMGCIWYCSDKRHIFPTEEEIKESIDLYGWEIFSRSTNRDPDDENPDNENPNNKNPDGGEPCNGNLSNGPSTNGLSTNGPSTNGSPTTDRMRRNPRENNHLDQKGGKDGGPCNGNSSDGLGPPAEVTNNTEGIISDTSNISTRFISSDSNNISSSDNTKYYLMSKIDAKASNPVEGGEKIRPKSVKKDPNTTENVGNAKTQTTQTRPKSSKQSETSSKSSNGNGSKKRFPWYLIPGSITEYDIQELWDYPITPAMFGVFWNAYPRKVCKGYAAAAWKNICKKPRDQRPTLGQILSAIEAQKKSDQWQDERFIPKPGSWLSYARWEDDPKQLTAPRKKPAPIKPETTEEPRPRSPLLDKIVDYTHMYVYDHATRKYTLIRKQEVKDAEGY